jgi:hypothetical protein
MTVSSRKRYVERVVPASVVYRTKADFDQFDALAIFPGLMVRSRQFGLARFRSLVRGVSNHGAAPSIETGAALCLFVPKHMS